MGSLKWWQLRRRLCLAELEKKRAVVHDLLALIALYSIDPSRDAIMEGFRNYLEWIEGMFEEAGRIKTLKEESKDIERNILQIQQGKKWKRRKKLHKQLVRQKQVDRELGALEKSDTGRFLEALRGVVQDLLRKSRRVFRYRDAYVGTGAFTRRITEAKLVIASEHVEKMEITPFEISFILKPDYYRSIDTHLEKTVGKHFPRTPFSVISGVEKERSEEDVRGTVRHEGKHNLLDGVPNIHTGGMSLAEVTKGVTSFNVKHLKAKNLLDGLHGEIIAASEQAERAWKSGEKNDFTALRTAGRETLKMLDSLMEAQKKKGDKNWIEELECVYRDICRKFYRIVRHMKVSLVVAGEIGEEATQAVHVLFVLLRPSKYHHILPYLKYKYGEERVGEILKKMKIT